MSQNGSHDSYEKEDQLRLDVFFCQKNLMFNFFSLIFKTRSWKRNNLVNHLYINWAQLLPNN